jgi:Ca2+-binding EF-hand superfamily protein
MFGSAQVKVAIPSDPRIDQKKKSLDLKDEDLEIIYELFNRYDKEGSGFISTADYFHQLLQIPASLFTDAMFDIIDSEYAGKITFGEFVDVTCTFACFETLEMMK